ncbi:hypothetical protein [Morganella morganii]|uniref:hypothetical protein n=1 Tax=Morganella morganii TaxID=582 RepID=UPI002367748C|nr:hypothetical protein [Morganella morganii]
MKYIDNFNDLQKALNSSKKICISKSIRCDHSIILPEGVELIGIENREKNYPLLTFYNCDGVGVSKNNNITNLNISVFQDKKAIFSTSCDEDLGSFHFENLVLTGQLSFITKGEFIQCNVTLNNIDIVSCNSSSYLEQPQKYGVNVLQGAFTVYNLSNNSDSNITLNAKNIMIGRPNAPVIGSGIFIAGFGDIGGSVNVTELHTLSVHSTGNIPYGVADMITAGVFISTGANAQKITHDGEIATYGVNDMVLDAWGKVGSWISNKPIISYGPSGVGFVNFGTVDTFIVNAELETYGLGARGYNQYDGTVNHIKFKSITTYGNGSVGIQVSKVIGDLTVDENVKTFGSIGTSLVKGVNVQLPANAISIKEGGEIAALTIGGNIETHGDSVVSFESRKGAIKSINIGGIIKAYGANSKDKNEL